MPKTTPLKKENGYLGNNMYRTLNGQNVGKRYKLTEDGKFDKWIDSPVKYTLKTASSMANKNRKYISVFNEKTKEYDFVMWGEKDDMIVFMLNKLLEQ